jgi:hypothetical protein
LLGNRADVLRRAG